MGNLFPTVRICCVCVPCRAVSGWGKVKSELKADGSTPRGVWLVRRSGSDDVVAVVRAADEDTIRALTPRDAWTWGLAPHLT